MLRIFLNLLLLLPLLVSIPACTLSKNANTSNLRIENLIGEWEYNDSIYIFEKDGEFFSPLIQTTSGNTWKVVDDTLELTFLDSPIKEARTESYKIVFLSSSKVTLEDKNGKRSTWSKADAEDIAQISGELFFLERIALPPQVVLRLDVMQNGQLIYSSLHHKSGNIPMNFTAYYPTDNVDALLPVELSAVIYYEENAIFNTPSPISLVQNEELHTVLDPIRLKRSEPDEISAEPILAPVAFNFTDKNGKGKAHLFLEEDHLFFLVEDIKSENEESREILWGHWNSVNKGYGLELIIYNHEPIVGTLSPGQVISFDSLPNFDDISHINFERFQVKGTKTQPFEILGTLSKSNNSYEFTPCGLTSTYPVTGNIEEIASRMGSHEKVSAMINALYARPKAFELENIVSISDELICPQATLSSSLTETYWKLTTLNDKPLSVEAESSPHLILRADEAKEGEKLHGQGSGSDGCNSFFLSWENGTVASNGEENALAFALGGSTMRLCPQEGIDQQVAEYMNSLASTNNYTIHGSVLKLKNNETTVATFEAVEF